MVRKIVLSLDSFKATPVGDIDDDDDDDDDDDIHLPLTTKIINLVFENNCFPDVLKLAEIMPSF